MCRLGSVEFIYTCVSRGDTKCGVGAVIFVQPEKPTTAKFIVARNSGVEGKRKRDVIGCDSRRELWPHPRARETAGYKGSEATPPIIPRTR